MKPIAVFYHVCLSYTGDPPIPVDFASGIMAEQMRDLKDSGLEDAASEIVILSNGGVSNLLLAATLAPAKARLLDNGVEAQSINPSVNKIREWLPGHRDWHVCFFHNKGATHPGDHFNQVWRKCMESCVIWGWRGCVNDLERGYDSVGAHWLTTARYGPQVVTPFWGGMFYWATSNFLSTLPPVIEKPTCRDHWFQAEGWIGVGPRVPKTYDYRPHWPGMGPCSG